jgi:hypothetical protein
MKPRPHSITIVFASLMLAGCAMDIVSVKQAPATIAPLGDSGPLVVLQSDVAVAIGTGFTTKLRKGTTWRQIGRISEGEVFATRDQIVTVEASNIHEAQPVINGGNVVGFYLPVERTFTRATAPIAITFQPSK